MFAAAHHGVLQKIDEGFTLVGFFIAATSQLKDQNQCHKRH
jgi:hypothetical protein